MTVWGRGEEMAAIAVGNRAMDDGGDGSVGGIYSWYNNSNTVFLECQDTIKEGEVARGDGPRSCSALPHPGHPWDQL